MKLDVTEVGPDLLARVVEARIDAVAAVQFRDAMRSATDGGQPLRGQGRAPPEPRLGGEERP